MKKLNMTKKELEKNLVRVNDLLWLTTQQHIDTERQMQAEITRLKKEVEKNKYAYDKGSIDTLDRLREEQLRNEE